MKSGTVTRRNALGAIGVGAAASAVSAASGRAFARDARLETHRAETLGSGSDVGPDGVNPPTDPSLELFAPLQAGDALGSWQVQRLLPLRDGAASLVLVDRSGVRFQLDVVKRGAVSAPGETEFCQVVLANHGDGAVATHEDHGLAAMALADVIRSNEQRVDLSGFRLVEERRSDARVHLVDSDEG